jgi:hypothetical protein
MHHPSTNVYRFTLGSLLLLYICPNSEGHDGQGGDHQALRSSAQIKLESNMQCSSVYFQIQHEVTILIGIKDHHPWIHLVTNPDLCRIIDPAAA